MTVGVDRPMIDCTADPAGATWVDAFADAVRRRDEQACAALVHDDVRVRLDGREVASGRDELIRAADGLLHTPHDDWIRILDRHVAGDDAFALFSATLPRRGDPARPGGDEGGAQGDTATGVAERRLLGYAILRVRDGRLDTADCYLDALPPVLDLRDGEPVIDLRDAPAHTPEPVLRPGPRTTPQPVGERPTTSPRGWRRLALPLAAIGSWVVQDLVLATPVVAFAAHFGSVAAFATFAPLYAALSLVLSLLTVRLLRRGAAPREGRLARWLASSDHHPVALRLLRAGGVVGFVVSSYLLSGPPTVWALHRFAVRRDLVRCAILASVTWGVTFVLSYLVVAELVLL
jgi:hypothetical protein